MKIPILNIYYLLSYAWDRLDPGEEKEVSQSDYSDSLNLLAHIFVMGVERLLKRGLSKEYSSREYDYPGIKGKVLIGESVVRMLPVKGKMRCEFDEYNHDNQLNRILKATLFRLSKTKEVDSNIYMRIKESYFRFAEVELVELDNRSFQNLTFHRNIRSYSFLIEVAKLLHDSLVLDEKQGNYRFRDFIRDERQMAYLFEKFVFNFYRREQNQFNVRREDIQWALTPVGDSDSSRLPKMQTDISLESLDRKIIIDTKYYKEALTNNYSEKYRSSNLYQLHAYLTNLQLQLDQDSQLKLDGILLYPTVNYDFWDSFSSIQNNISLATINLYSNWKTIKKRLHELIDQ